MLAVPAVAVMVLPDSQTIGVSRACIVVPKGMIAFEMMLYDVPDFTKKTLMDTFVSALVLEMLIEFTNAVPTTPE
jgi:hypothetical protein